MVKDSEDIKQLIINSAVKLFDRYGYKNVKISQITKEIGMTTGAFYYYFQSKEEILHIVANYYITIVANMAQEIYDRTDLSVKEKLQLLIKNHCRGIKDYQSHVSVFYREYRNLSKEGLEFVIQKNRQFLHCTSSLIDEGIKEGFFKKKVNAKIVALGIIGMCNWIYQWYREEGDLNIDEISDIFIQFISTGLLVTKDE